MARWQGEGIEFDASARFIARRGFTLYGAAVQDGDALDIARVGEGLMRKLHRARMVVCLPAVPAPPVPDAALVDRLAALEAAPTPEAAAPPVPTPEPPEAVPEAAPASVLTPDPDAKPAPKRRRGKAAATDAATPAAPPQL